MVFQERMGLIVGRLQMHPKGYGFVVSDKSEVSDVFIPANLTNGAMNNDKVIARKDVVYGELWRKTEGK